MGELIARFVFTATNVSSGEVVVDEVKSGCGCTVPRTPDHPWRLAPGASGGVELAVDVRGVSGVLSRYITVTISNVTEQLAINVAFPPGFTNVAGTPEDERLWNQEVSRGDHQAPFQNNCVRCHLVPAFGKSGQRLYRVACGVCHDSPRRAPMVPDLHALKKPTDAAYWRKWITDGKAGTLMPGFAAVEGGPLDTRQIESLVEYLTQTISPATNAPAAKPRP